MGWLVAVESPDEGITNYKYRKDGKIRYSQNAQQEDNESLSADGRFSYTEYDDAGRIIEVGDY